MTFLFIILSFAFISVLINQRLVAIGLTIAGLIFGLAVFWHHLTDILNINL